MCVVYIVLCMRIVHMSIGRWPEGREKPQTYAAIHKLYNQS